jgi:hypothetical protein
MVSELETSIGDPELKVCSAFHLLILFRLVLSLINLHLFLDRGEDDVKIHADVINRSVIAVQIHAAMVSRAVNDLQNREALKKLWSN